MSPLETVKKGHWTDNTQVPGNFSAKMLPPAKKDVLHFREVHGLTQAELAAMLGVTARTVRAWEAGTNRRTPPPFLWHALFHISSHLKEVELRRAERTLLAAEREGRMLRGPLR